MEITFVVNSAFRKLIRVNEAFKQCEWQEVFDVMLAAVVHNVFETDQMESALPENGHKVHFTMSWSEQFGSIRLAYGGFSLLQVSPLPPHQFALITVNVPHQMGRNFQILLVQKKTIIFLWVFSVSPLSTRVIPFFFSLVFLRACTRRYMHNLGSTLKRIRSQTNCYL